MGGTFSTLRRMQPSKEQTLITSKSDDDTKQFQDKDTGASVKNMERAEKITDLPSEQQLTGDASQIGENVKSDSVINEGRSEGTSKVSLGPGPAEEGSLQVKKRPDKQEEITDTVDEAPFPPIPPMPRDNDEIKLDENLGSPGARSRNIYVSGDDREPELEFDEEELEMDPFTSAETTSRRISSDNTSVMVVGEPRVRHPFPSSPDKGVDGSESITVVVNVESRYKGKRHRSTHSFTSLGSEPGKIRNLTSNKILDRESEDEVQQSIEQDARKEDVVEVKVDFYRKKRRRNCSAPCGYSALQESERSRRYRQTRYTT